MSAITSDLKARAHELKGMAGNLEGTADVQPSKMLPKK